MLDSCFVRCWIVLVFGFVCVLSLSVELDDCSFRGTAAEQQEAVLLKAGQEPKSHGSWPSATSLFKIFFEDMTPTVEHVCDEMPSGRQKLIHSRGAVATIEWSSTTFHNFSGLFQGAKYGLARVSVAAKPDYSKANGVDGGFLPGVGIKLFRDQTPSGNFVAMRDVSPQSSWNIFANPWSNHIGAKNLAIAQKLLSKKFEQVSKNWPGSVGLSDFAMYSADGDKVGSSLLKFPYQVVFEPNPYLKSLFPDSNEGLEEDAYLSQLNQVPSGILLWKVFALSSPTDDHIVHIGDIRSTSQFSCSAYWDEVLFFKHQRFEEDIALRPDFVTVRLCGQVDFLFSQTDSLFV